MTDAAADQIVVLEATVIRADGTVEELGVIASTEDSSVVVTDEEE